MGTLSERIACLEEDICSGEFSDLDAMRELRSIYLIAKEADELMERMLAALEDCAREDADGLDAAMAKDTVTMYYEWKERTK